MKRLLSAFVLGIVTLTPLSALGQQFTTGSIAGQVKDTTGAVLAGVTVEASSPALIEKVRLVVTDAAGQYRIIDLRPGTYTVTFTLSGFGTVQKPGIELTTGFTAAVNADMSVGELQETVTVTGASPVVDVQNVTRQTVFSSATLDEIPSSQIYSSVAKLVPGMESSGNYAGIDVGGSVGRDGQRVMIHGGNTIDFRLLIDGMPQGGFFAGAGDDPGVVPASSVAEESTIQISGLSAEAETGGVHYNMVPKTGGNRFQGAVTGNFANGGMQSNNLTAALEAQSTVHGKIKYVADINPTIGGPVVTDRLWYFAGYREDRPVRYSTAYPNANPNGWTYVPDTSKKPALDDRPQRLADGRLTWQASQRNRFSVGLQWGKICQCHNLVGFYSGSITAPEASPITYIENRPVVFASWVAPLTNKLLLDVGGMFFKGHYWGIPQPEAVSPAVTEISNNTRFRSNPGLSSTGYTDIRWGSHYLRASLSRTTGSHALKFGTQVWLGDAHFLADSYGLGPYSLNLLNSVPQSVVYRMDPLLRSGESVNVGVYAQDQWTVKRLTLNLGLRFDSIDIGYPDQFEQATAYFPARQFAAGDLANWKDVSPRSGLSYDLFGNGRTAIKATASRYVASEGPNTLSGSNPANASSGSLTRTLTSVPPLINGVYVPQGDPTNPEPNGNLGRSPNANWGQSRITTRTDPDVVNGWGKRGYQWEFGANIVQQLFSRTSVDVGYFRRVFGNFLVTDNLATGPSDFSQFCITAPRNPALPDGGGQEICGLYNVNPAKFGQQDILETSSDNYGKQTRHYNGIAVSVNQRLSQGLVLQGGVSSGSSITDICDLIDTLPELLISGSTVSPASRCHLASSWLKTMQVKFLASYKLPWDFDVAATYQNSANYGANTSFIFGSLPGIAANYLATNAQIAPSLGRNLSAGPNSNVTVNLIEPGTMFEDRLQQIDLRVARTFRTGGTSVRLVADLYNLLNAGPVIAWNNTYGTTGASWLNPLNVFPARLLKIGAQLNF